MRARFLVYVCAHEVSCLNVISMRACRHSQPLGHTLTLPLLPPPLSPAPPLFQDLITNVSMYVSIALVIILMARMGYAFYDSKCCNESWDHKVRVLSLSLSLSLSLYACIMHTHTPSHTCTHPHTRKRAHA